MASTAAPRLRMRSRSSAPDGAPAATAAPVGVHVAAAAASLTSSSVKCRGPRTDTVRGKLVWRERDLTKSTSVFVLGRNGSVNLSQPGAQDGCERRGHRGRALPFRLGDLLHDQVYLDLCRKDAVKRAFRVLGDLAEEIIHVRRPPQRVNLPRDRREPGFCQRLKGTGSLWNGMRRLHGRYVEAS